MHTCSLRIIKRELTRVNARAVRTQLKVAGGNHSDTLTYADDVGLITCSASELQGTINEWCTALKDHGLKL